MTEEDLQYIEEELDVSLPSDYRALLRDFPFSEGGSWVDGLYDDPDDIVNETRFPQEDGGYDKHNWKQTYVVVGQSAADVAYQFDTCLIDSTLNPSPVYLLNHEDHSIVEKWPSLQAFVSDYQEEQIKRDAARISRERQLYVIYLVILVGCLLIWMWIMRKR